MKDNANFQIEESSDANDNSSESASGRSKQVWSLYIGFSLIILIISLLTFFGVSRYAAVNDRLNSVVSIHNVRLDLALKLRVISRERAPILHAMANTEDPFEREDLKLVFSSLGEQFLKAREVLIKTGLNDEEARLLEEHRNHAKTVIPQQRHVIDLVDLERFVEARNYLVNVVVPTQAEALKLFDTFIDYQQSSARGALNDAQAVVQDTYTWAAVLSASGILLSLVIAIVVSQRLNNMLTTIRNAKNRLEDRVRDRTHELSLANERLEHLASTDGLTGLPNRTSFYANLELSLAQAGHHNCMTALHFIDLDGFKAVNDTYGHDCGDELLRQVSLRLKEKLRDNDIICRLGGDEFTIIQSGFKQFESATKMAQKIIDTINMPFEINGISCSVGSSIGVSIYPDHAGDMESLIKLADDMMYEVKKSGKNAFRIYTSV
ncbi:MAG: diguanylate cyclase [Gammaproteobacteria bacterium (ex Lamellibrachia satsuma)]|nr:MAG: diguanylate cyclase [Gammaproteobacteria bacterium (ex Lamellibrachia satsuma)]